MTIYSTCTLNEYGYAKTDSKNTANKIWSIASGWSSLITGKRNAKKVMLGMNVHRLTATKEVLSVLNKAGHTISYDDVRLQNDYWLTSLSSLNEMFNGLEKGIVTHSSIDNNDGRQETNTGHHTTHHTNSLLFQPILPGDESRIVPPGDTAIDVDHQNDKFQDIPLYKIGKLVPPPLFTNYEDSTAHDLLDKCFAMDLIWALAGGIPNNINDEPFPLLGSWIAYQKAVCNSEVTLSSIKYLPATLDPSEYSVCKEYLDFLLDTTSYLEIPHIFVHADEQVYPRIRHLIWKHGESYSTIIPMLGGFHQLRVLQKIIFKRHGVIGYKDWFVDAGTIAEGLQ